MSAILLILGIVVAASGIAAIGFGIPINEFTLGTTLIVAGTTALTGGLILIGLSAVVSELGRLAEGAKTRVPGRTSQRPGEAADLPSPLSPAIGSPLPAAAAAARPATTNVPVPPRMRPEQVMRPPVPQPVPSPSAVEVSAAAIERLRSSIPRNEPPRVEPSPVGELEEVPLSPSGAAQHQQARTGAEVPPAEPRVAGEDRGSAAAVEALKASRLDFLFRSKPAPARPAPQPENFDAIWPADTRASRAAPSEPHARFEQVERQAEAPLPAERRLEPPPAEPPPGASILKSGVVDGMAYTLYADGSIEAKLPHGTVRFGSIAELRAHIESNS